MSQCSEKIECRFYKDGKCTYGGEPRDCAYECKNSTDQ